MNSESRKPLPLFENFPTQAERLNPYSPKSWKHYERYVTSSDIWPDDDVDKRALTFKACEAFEATGDITSLTSILKRGLESIENGTLSSLTPLEQKRLDYWKTRISLLDPNFQPTTNVSFGTPKEPFQIETTDIQTDEEYELACDFQGLRVLLTIARGDMQEAGTQTEALLERLLHRFGENHPKVFSSQSRLAHIYRLQRSHEDAQRISQDLLTRLAESPPFNNKDHPLVIQNRFYTVSDRLVLGDTSPAIMAELGRLLIRQRINYPTSLHTATLMRDMAAAEQYYCQDSVSPDPALKAIFQNRAQRHASLAQQLASTHCSSTD